MGNLNLFLIISILVSILAFAFAVWLYRWVSAQPSSNPRVKDISAELVGKVELGILGFSLF